VADYKTLEWREGSGLPVLGGRGHDWSPFSVGTI
jgi:hypothetical protein